MEAKLHCFEINLPSEVLKPGLEPSMSVACFRLLLSTPTVFKVVSMAMTMLPPPSPLPSLDGGRGVDERSAFLFTFSHDFLVFFSHLN